LDEVVFVGGATVHLWLSEPGAPPTRATEDVDVICEVASRAEYSGSARSFVSEVCKRRPAHLCCVGGIPLSRA
jgi:hypothetical protein